MKMVFGADHCYHWRQTAQHESSQFLQCSIVRSTSIPAKTCDANFLSDLPQDAACPMVQQEEKKDRYFIYFAKHDNLKAIA